MKHHEDGEQAAVFEWASYYPDLRYMFAIANGTHLAGGDKQRAMQMARLKKQGLKNGVLDIFLPIAVRRASGHYNGLFIEMKRRKVDGPSSVSRAQSDFIIAMSVAGYKAVVCYGAEEAIAEIRKYCNL